MHVSCSSLRLCGRGCTRQAALPAQAHVNAAPVAAGIAARGAPRHIDNPVDDTAIVASALARLPLSRLALALAQNRLDARASKAASPAAAIAAAGIAVAAVAAAASPHLLPRKKRLPLPSLIKWKIKRHNGMCKLSSKNGDFVCLSVCLYAVPFLELNLHISLCRLIFRQVGQRHSHPYVQICRCFRSFQVPHFDLGICDEKRKGRLNTVSLNHKQ